MTETTYPEIERAAVTILANHRRWCHHPVLREYVNALVAEPAEQRWLDEWLTAWLADPPAEMNGLGESEFVAEEVRQAARAGQNDWWRLPEPSVYGHDRLSTMIYDRTAYDRSQDSGYRNPWSEMASWDVAILSLAHAIRSFRAQGRPSGDQRHEIMGLGSPVAVVTTSLAAALAEFVTGIEEIWAGRVHAAREAD